MVEPQPTLPAGHRARRPARPGPGRGQGQLGSGLGQRADGGQRIDRVGERPHGGVLENRPHRHGAPAPATDARHHLDSAQRMTPEHEEVVVQPDGRAAAFHEDGGAQDEAA